jgi:hypothetical protein
MLQRASIVAIVGELVSAGVPEHVWVDAEWHLGGLAEALDEPVKAYGAPPQLAQDSHFVAPDRMDAWHTILDPVDMQAPLGKLDLVPLQVAHLRARNPCL